MSDEIPSRQEMFDRAVVGLRSQGFKKCTDITESVCSYVNDDGTMHCAWGWVDTSTKASYVGSVWNLRQMGRGLAARLELPDVGWAHALQICHDRSTSPADMEKRLREFAKRFDLTFKEAP